MADNVSITEGNIATDEIGGAHYQRVKLTFGTDGTATDASNADPLPVTITGTIPVSGTFYQATQPVSIAGTVAVSGPLTDTQLRATALPVSGTFWQATQPVSGTVTANAGTGTFAVSGPLTDTQLRASAVPVSLTSTTITGSVAVTGTFWQATQPVSGTVTANAGTGTFGTNLGQIAGTTTATGNGTVSAGVQRVAIASDNTAFSVNATGPSLTKGTQGSTGFSTQDLKDAGRASKIFSATFTAATTEALITLTPVTDGAAGATGTSFTVTNGKRFRIQSLVVTTRNAGAAVQGVVVNLRTNTGGATTATSPLIATAGAGTTTATANCVDCGSAVIPDGLEILGNGTTTIGISQVGTATAGNTVTLIGYEY